MTEIEVIQNFNAKHHLRALSHLEDKSEININSFLALDFITQTLEFFRGNKQLKEIFTNLSIFFSSLFWKDKIVYVSRYAFDPLALPYLYLLKSRNNVIYHSSWPYWEGERTPKPVKKIIPKQTDLWYGFLKDVEVALITEIACQNLGKKGINARNIPHSVNTNLFRPKDSSSNRESKRVLFVGRFVERKGVPEIIDAIQNNEWGDVQFHFAGKGPLEDKLIGLEQEYSYVKVHGFISDKEELAKLYRDSDVLILPSRKTEKGEKLYPWEELFGMVIIEAFASGIPVISTKNVGPSDIIESGETGYLIEDRNEKELSDKIRLLCEADDKRRKMGSKARKKAEKEYSLEKVSEKWLKLIREVET